MAICHSIAVVQSLEPWSLLDCGLWPLDCGLCHSATQLRSLAPGVCCGDLCAIATPLRSCSTRLCVLPSTYTVNRYQANSSYQYTHLVSQSINPLDLTAGTWYRVPYAAVGRDPPLLDYNVMSL